MMDELARLIVITGNMAAGKSSVAQALAQRLPRSVHLRGDLFRRMIVNGRAEPGADLSDEALRQLRLRYRLAAVVAKEYLEAGFTVVYQDIILGAGLEDVLRLYEGHQVWLVVLCPRAEVVASRDASRHKTGYPDEESVRVFDDILRTRTPRLGYWLDNSELSVEQTVDAILENLPRAVVS